MPLQISLFDEVLLYLILRIEVVHNLNLNLLKSLKMENLTQPSLMGNA
jgi:hypothetical protein